VQNMLHYAQAVTSDNFQMYDFGKSGNMKHYGQSTPPKYDLAALIPETVVYYGGQDKLADKTDAERILPQIRPLRYSQFLSYYGHADFVWGQNAAALIYSPLLKLLG